MGTGCHHHESLVFGAVDVSLEHLGLEEPVTLMGRRCHEATEHLVVRAIDSPDHRHRVAGKREGWGSGIVTAGTTTQDRQSHEPRGEDASSVPGPRSPQRTPRR